LPKRLLITTKFTFKKEEKLKSRKLIEQLFASGKSFSVSPFRITYILSAKEAYILQSGFGTSAKKFKRAVERNRIKRLMREAYRLQKKSLNDTLQNRDRSMAAFFIYTGNTIDTYDVIYKAMQACLKKLEKIVNEITDADS